MRTKIIRIIGNVIDRREFLGKCTAVTGALLAGIFAAPKPAHACTSCCHLCYASSSNCGSPDCSWAWSCPNHDDCHYYWCEEFIHLRQGNPCQLPCGTNNYCGSGCAAAGVYCSQATMSAPIYGCIPP